MKKIKVFLGGYINYTNAQNLNCRALAKHLPENKFEIYTMALADGALDTLNKRNVHEFICRKPLRLTQYLAYLWGIYHCDIAYLPKAETDLWCKFWIKTLRKKAFRTVEGIYGEELLGQILKNGTSYRAFKRTFEGFDGVYSITKHVKYYNRKHHDIKSDETILYLGTECQIFLNENKTFSSLKNIVYIGHLIRRKGVFDVVEVAKHFPSIHFFLVGEGNERKELENFIRLNGLRNVTLTGLLTHEKLASLLKNMDLHFFPSRSEGFPKVLLETAAAGVPSIVYPDYGADEWIENRKNGFIVNDYKEAIEVIKEYAEQPNSLAPISKNAIEMAKRFDWNIVIKDWEKVIVDIINDKNTQ